MLETSNIFEYNLIFNTMSFTFAVMFATTVYLFLGRNDVGVRYRSAVTISGIVTLIAAYHYWQIFGSFKGAYALMNDEVTFTGTPFNDAYRYVDWLLTVPLLLVELILVMNLSAEETKSRALKLGLAAALMVLLGYPGEISLDIGTRWLWWGLAMIPFIYIVYELVVGLRHSIERQPANVRGHVSMAAWLVILSWSFYPIVFLAPMFGVSGTTSYSMIQVGYSIADIVAKAVFGVVIFVIAKKKSAGAPGVSQ